MSEILDGGGGSRKGGSSTFWVVLLGGIAVGAFVLKSQIGSGAVVSKAKAATAGVMRSFSDHDDDGDDGDDDQRDSDSRESRRGRGRGINSVDYEPTRDGYTGPNGIRRYR